MAHFAHEMALPDNKDTIDKVRISRWSPAASALLPKAHIPFFFSIPLHLTP